MQQKILGMTIGQLIILSVLGCLACALVGFAGSMLLTLNPAAQPAAPQTYTPAPSPTPPPTSTPLATITAIPNWNEFRFADDQASIWLPASYSGGNTTTSSDAIIQKLRSATRDEAFINDIQELIVLPEIKFFAFDTNFDDGSKSMYVGNEVLTAGSTLTMDEYLNRMMNNFTGGERVVERQIVDMDRFPAGKLVIENKVPAGEGEAFISMAIYTIRSGDTMWFITFRTGRDEFKDNQATIEASINSFWAQP